jgi:gluconolactonase
MPELVEVASGLSFPEGPIAMLDGSVILVEMFGPRLTRILPDGSKHTIAEIPGGPNGAAIGPSGTLFLCNNGGSFTPIDLGGIIIPGPVTMSSYIGGRIQTVDLESGAVTDLYTECDGHPLRGPNDIVFDDHGGFYFTDHGLKDESQRVAHMTGILYAAADGSLIREVVFPAHEPNGIGLSPDGRKLYWAETWTGRIMQRDIVAPGEVAPAFPGDPSVVLHGFPGAQLLDSLAVDSDGNVCVATIGRGGVSVVSPEGELIDFVEVGDIVTTNICFGGEDLRTAYITASSTGRLLRTEWPRPGGKLRHLNE